MEKQIDKMVGISCSGFIAARNGKPIASAKTFDGLVNKGVIKGSLGDESLIIKYVVPEGMIRIY